MALLGSRRKMILDTARRAKLGEKGAVEDDQELLDLADAAWMLAPEEVADVAPRELVAVACTKWLTDGDARLIVVWAERQRLPELTIGAPVPGRRHVHGDGAAGGSRVCPLGRSGDVLRVRHAPLADSTASAGPAHVLPSVPGTRRATEAGEPRSPRA